MISFDAWLPVYLSWRGRSIETTGHALPTDLALLHREQQELEPMYSAAESYRADAEFYAREAVDTKNKIRARIVWALEDSAGRCRVITSRAFKVAQQIKMQDKSHH